MVLRKKIGKKYKDSVKIIVLGGPTEAVKVITRLTVSTIFANIYPRTQMREEVAYSFKPLA
jgi:hypothetical protein